MNRRLTVFFPMHRRCVRCDNILTASTFKGISVVVCMQNSKYSKVLNPKKSYYCVRCEIKLRNPNSKTIPLQEIEQFVEKIKVLKNSATSSEQLGKMLLSLDNSVVEGMA
jgi:hypothetical protein